MRDLIDEKRVVLVKKFICREKFTQVPFFFFTANALVVFMFSGSRNPRTLRALQVNIIAYVATQILSPCGGFSPCIPIF